MSYCKQCHEEFDPTERDEEFCSWGCAEAHWDNAADEDED